MKRKCKLSDSENRQVDLLQYKDEIIDTINRVVPGKNPEVFHDSFQTDPLERGESVKLGRALAKIPGLSKYGKEVTIFRLFAGELVETEAEVSQKVKGGRMK